ncbi:MAG: NAD-dependent succinate-semialdehyde dehydrogenase [Halobacteriota archaeon]
MRSLNPATGACLQTYDPHAQSAVDAKLERASEAFEQWRSTPVEERQARVEALASALRDGKREYAELMAREMGKPLSQGIAEVEKCAWACEYYAERTAEHLQSEYIGTEPEATTYVSYEPLGPLLAVMPWNYPFWQVFRFAAPALTAGNVALLKHAPSVFGCASAIESLFLEAGYPEGVFASIRVEADRVAGIVADDRIRGVTLTGSTRAGRAVAATSGEHLKKTVLELGGSDPFIVLDDAPLDAVVEAAVTGRYQNSGQSCIAAKRFFVHESVADDFVEAFTTEVDALAVGDPMDPQTDVGPMARADLRETLDDQVSASVEAGATVECGARALDRDGYYYAPTVLTDVPDDAPAAREELFGPVAAVFEFESVDEVVERANDTQYGLGASVWTGDRTRGEALVPRLEVGNAAVNQIVKSDPRVPFSGVKDSGYGSELGPHGAREFTNAKTVWVEDAPTTTETH